MKKDYSKEEKQIIKEWKNKFPNIGLHSLYFEKNSEGKLCWYIKKFGIIKKEVEIPTTPIFMNIEVIKAVCCQCKKKIVVFDNRYYGFDGTTSKHTEEREYTPNLNKINNNLYNIEIIIENEDSLDNFNEIIGEKCSMDFYSNSFSWIRINKIDEKGKKTLVEDIETS